MDRDLLVAASQFGLSTVRDDVVSRRTSAPGRAGLALVHLDPPLLLQEGEMAAYRRGGESEGRREIDGGDGPVGGDQAQHMTAGRSVRLVREPRLRTDRGDLDMRRPRRGNLCHVTSEDRSCRPTGLADRRSTGLAFRA